MTSDDVTPDADATAGANAPASTEPAAADVGGAIEDDTSPESRVTRVGGRDVVVEPRSDVTDNATVTGGMESTADQGARPTGEGFEFNDLQPPQNIRVIRVPVAAVRRGDLRYNIAIRPKDQIVVPYLNVGEYYMGGHVATPGVYTLRANHVTLKQAVISARMLDSLAIPARTDVIRRLAPDREVYVRVDLDKVFAGTQPDFYLKPDDQVMVGTNFLAPFLAAIRGGFRMTYGFGFIYDRNFDDNNNN
jgi:hypothetical protein